MKKLNLFVMVLVFAANVFAADAFTERLQRGLFEEEANRNLDAAIKEYQAVVTQADEERRVTATALFRLGECYRKLGKTNEAAAFYQRVARDFSEQEQLAKLAADFLKPAAPPVTGQSALTLELERKLAALKVESITRQMEADRLAGLSRDDLINTDAVQKDAGYLSLMQQGQVISQKAVDLKAKGFGDEHPEMKALNELRKKLIEQIEERLKVIVAGAQERAKQMAAQVQVFGDELMKAQNETGAAARPAPETASLTQAEAEELARVKTLARNSPDLLSAPYKEGLTPLQYAAREGFPTVLEFVLAQGVNVNGAERATPPLVMAADRGHLRIVEVLLNRGADANAAGTSGRTALIAAAEKDFKAVAELLLARGADVNAVKTDANAANPVNGTALHAAVWTGSSNMVAALLANKADPNILSRPWGSFGGNQPTVERNEFDWLYGAAPLHLAARHDLSVIASLLLKAGARVNASNWAGATPLHIAVAVPQTNVMNLLLANGADPDARERVTGATPLALAIQKDAEITQALLAVGAKVNEPAYDRPGFFTHPLHLAAGQSKPDVLRVVLAAKPELEVTNIEWRTPLWSALMINPTTNLQMLINAGADIRKPLGDFSPLQSAVARGNDAGASMLIKAGADPNQTHADGDSLLHRASRGRLSTVVRVLLEGGANPNVFNRKLETPLSIAENGAEGGISAGRAPADQTRDRSEWRAIAEILKRHGTDEFMQRRLRISARRGANEYPIFTRGTNVLNRFTLMELLGSVFQFGSLREPGRFSWPDLNNLRIHRINGTNQIVLTVKLSDALERGDCSGDQWLEWGDEVEIPERIHPLNAGWDALSGTEAGTLTNCMARTVRVAVSGTNINVRLQPYVRSENGERWLNNDKLGFAFLPIVLRNEGDVNRQLRSTSDLSRVSVRRSDPVTKELRTMTFDITDVAIPNAASGSTLLEHSLWLRDGDVIEVPEKP